MTDEEKEKKEEEKEEEKKEEVITYNIQPHDSVMDVIWQIK